MLTKNSRIKEIYANPIGRDIINRVLLQMKISKKAINNPIIGNLKIKDLPKLLKNRLDDEFIDVLLNLSNTEKEIVRADEGPIKKLGGRKQYFIRFIQEVLRIVMVMVLGIYKVLSVNWTT